MDDVTKQFLKLKKRVRTAKKHAAKGKVGADARHSAWSQALLIHITKHGKPQGY